MGNKTTDLFLVLKKEAYEVTGTEEKPFELRKPSRWIKQRLFNKDGSKRHYDTVTIQLGTQQPVKRKVFLFNGFFETKHEQLHEFSNGLKFLAPAGYYWIELGINPEKHIRMENAELMDKAKEAVNKYGKPQTGSEHTYNFGLAMFIEGSKLADAPNKKPVPNTEELSSMLKKFCDDNNYTSKPLHTVMPFILEFLAELPLIAEGGEKWKNANEELPSEDDWYLVIHKKITYPTVRAYNKELGFCDVHITHWMPLPQAPKI